MSKSPFSKLIRQGSINNRRRGHKAAETRKRNEARREKLAAEFAEKQNEPAVIVERKVLRTCKDWYFKLEITSSPDLKKEEVIDFERAAWEVSRRWTSSRFAELLDQGEIVETDKAAYRLFSSVTIETTYAEAARQGLQSASKIMTLVKQAR